MCLTLSAEIDSNLNIDHMNINRHYSNSRPVNWMRRVFEIHKPNSLPWGQWETWGSETKKAHPIGWFLTETLPEWIELIPRYTIDHWYTLRKISRNLANNSHCLSSPRCKPGHWYELDTRILYCLFDSLVDYVEVECASQNYEMMPKRSWMSILTFGRWGKNIRCPEAGIAAIRSEMMPEMQSQSHNQVAREQMALYVWWKEIRPARENDPANLAYKEFTRRMDAKYDGEPFNRSKYTPAESAEFNALIDSQEQFDKRCEDEDTEMLCRLIKIRNTLWT